VEPKVDPSIKRAEMDLPPVSQQRNHNGNMMAGDMDILKAASSDMFKKDKHYDPYADFDPLNDPFKQKDDDKVSMKELMKRKLEKADDPNVEKVDDRKARLKAQRDLLVKKKQEERDDELKDARDGKTENQYSNNLLKDLLALDKKVNAQEQKKKFDVDRKKPQQEVLQVDDFDDDMPAAKQQPKPKKDMKSLFDDSDDEEELKKQSDLKARQERQKNVMKQLIQEGN
jgi:hypothetical protein